MLLTRAVKLTMVISIAVFAFLVTIGNITDYGANLQYVRHVMSMDTILPGSALTYRAVTEPLLWSIVYVSIILGEGLTCLALGIGAVELARSLRGRADDFERSKRFVVIGAGVGFLVWFLGFMVVGGEWFAMWQSKEWNGQEAAFRFYVTLLAVVIFVNQHEYELGAAR